MGSGNPHDQRDLGLFAGPMSMLFRAAVDLNL